MPYRLSNRQISFFPHPSLRQAWYLFELQHQSHSDNGFFDIAAVCRVVQPIGNVLRCIPLAEFGRQMMLWTAPALWHRSAIDWLRQTQSDLRRVRPGNDKAFEGFKGIGEDMTKRPQLIRGSMVAQPLYYPNPTPKNAPPRHGADPSCDHCTK